MVTSTRISATPQLLRQVVRWPRPEKIAVDVLCENQTAQPKWLPTSIDVSKIPEIMKFEPPLGNRRIDTLCWSDPGSRGQKIVLVVLSSDSFGLSAKGSMSEQRIHGDALATHNVVPGKGLVWSGKMRRAVRRNGKNELVIFRDIAVDPGDEHLSCNDYSIFE
jgi:hypothetical protein